MCHSFWQKYAWLKRYIRIWSFSLKLLKIKHAKRIDEIVIYVVQNAEHWKKSAEQSFISKLICHYFFQITTNFTCLKIKLLRKITKLQVITGCGVNQKTHSHRSIICQQVVYISNWWMLIAPWYSQCIHIHSLRSVPLIQNTKRSYTPD